MFHSIHCPHLTLLWEEIVICKSQNSLESVGGFHGERYKVEWHDHSLALLLLSLLADGSFPALVWPLFTVSSSFADCVRFIVSVPHRVSRPTLKVTVVLKNANFLAPYVSTCWQYFPQKHFLKDGESSYFREVWAPHKTPERCQRVFVSHPCWLIGFF